jgi:glycosyltransferase involved in cell wall biosynthesis
MAFDILGMMIIGVDTGCLSVKEETAKVGVFNATVNLLLHLIKLEKKNKYFLYSFKKIDSQLLKKFGPRVKNVVAGPPFGWRYFGLPKSLRKTKPDVFLAPSQALPVFNYSPSIVFVHDLAFELFPELYGGRASRLSRLTKHAVKNARAIIADSYSTKEDLVKIYKVSKEKIKVVHLGVEEIFKPQLKENIEKIRRKYRLKKPYFLFVGAFKPIKNIDRIIKACKKFESHELVLVGGKSGVRDRVRVLGYVPREDLPSLYSGASVFISPSLYEGFGLPLVEAMSCGTPVVASNTGSVPEVVGKAGVLLNPISVDDIAAGLKKAINRREQLAKLSLTKARKFSWDKAAREVLQIIDQI